ncbi:MAG TPA: DUF3352 domain-containing protein [Thermoguttaceae bacterium]|nr:DUF3352 domain-containing protein [Thermoguttaceae bacterium]
MTANSPRLRHRTATIVAVTLLLGALNRPVLADRPSAPHLLPISTVAVVSVADAPEMAEKFMNTSLGRMSQDPQLKPLLEHLYGAVVEATAVLKEQVGLTLTELLAIPQGELTLALVAPEEGPPAVVVLLDAGNQLSNARKLLKRGTDALDESPAVRSEKTVSGTKIVIYDNVGPQRRQAAYFEKDDTIVAATDVGVLEQMLKVWDGGKGDTLADNQNFTAIMSRCRGENDERPQLIGYVDPIGIMRSIAQGNTQMQLALIALPALGLDGLSGIGGSVILDTEQFDSILHVHVLLESPRTGVLKMIAFESGEAKPEDWVPADVASYTTLHWNIEKTYKSLAVVYDSFNGEGALAKELERRILGPTGIDFEKEFLQALDGRITMITRIERPIRLGSQATLVGLKLADKASIEKALEKVFKLPDSNLTRETYAGKKYFRVDRPRFREMPPEQRPPQPSFGIVGDYLMVTNQASLLEKVIATAADGSNSLAKELDFKLIAGKIQRQAGGATPALVSFNRPEEIMAMLYELAIAENTRTRLAAAGENNPFLRSVDKALKENPLPPFAVIRQYLAPGGAMVVDDETGIHYTAFSLRRTAE